MPRPSLPALRRLGATALAVTGVGLVAASVSGIAEIDGTLAAEAERAAPAHVRDVSLERPTRPACPEPSTPPRRGSSAAYY